MDHFLQVLVTLPSAEPFVAPDSEGFRQLVSAMAVMAGAVPA